MPMIDVFRSKLESRPTRNLDGKPNGDLTLNQTDNQRTRPRTGHEANQEVSDKTRPAREHKLRKA